MAIIIDSMLWIYDFDPFAPESKNVKSWLRGERGALRRYKRIVLNTIIPLEVLHSIGRKPSTDFTLAYNATMAMISLKNVDLVDLDASLLKTSIETFSKYRVKGIGTRDASLLATMLDNNVDEIATHDKNILSIEEITRIDPVFSPPLVLNVGEALDEKEFKQK